MAGFVHLCVCLITGLYPAGLSLLKQGCDANTHTHTHLIVCPPLNRVDGTASLYQPQ